MSIEDLSRAVGAAHHIVDGVPPQGPGPDGAEFGRDHHLREMLSANTDWHGVLELYLGREASDGPGTPVSALPTVVEYLRGDDRAATHDTAASFYNYVQSNSLLADPDIHADNVHAIEAAEQEPPASTAALLDRRQAQTRRLGNYAGEYRISLGNLMDPYIGDVRQLADLIAPPTGNRLAATSEIIRRPVQPALAPLDAQLRRLASQHVDETDAERYRNPATPDSLTVAFDGDQSQLSHISMDPTDFQTMCNIAVNTYPQALMAGRTTFQILRSGPYRRKTGHVDFDAEGNAILQLWPDEIVESSTTGDPDRQQRDPKARLMALVEEVLDHELAHVVHSNASVEWLRRWDDMLSSGISLRELSTYTRGVDDARPIHSHHNGELNKAQEQIAEAIQVYRSDPVSILNATGSVVPFMLLQELLHDYSDGAVARNLTDLHLPLDEGDAERIRRDLTEDRQRVLQARLRAAGIHP